MQNLESSFSYTKEMISHKIKTMGETHFKQELSEIDNYLRNESHRTVVYTSLSSLSSWYLWNFIYEFTENKTVKYDLLAQSTYYGTTANKWAYSIGQCSVHYDGALLFLESSMHLAQLVCLGLDQQAVNYCSMLKAMLDGKQSKMFPNSPVHPWFILDLYLRYHGESMDKSWRVPSEIGPYHRVLECWDTTDNSLFEEMIKELCDFHISQSDEYEHDGNLLEFSSAQYFLFPPEILMWIKLRHNKKLYIGNRHLHPLLGLDINNLPLVPFNMKRDPMVIKCFEKLQKDNPTVGFEFMV